MNWNPAYRKAFFAALIMHLVLGLALLSDSGNLRPTLIQESRNESGQLQPKTLSDQPKPEIIRAVSIDNQEVMATVTKLKEARAQQIRKEQTRQQALMREAEQARKERLQEQQHLAKLKAEAAKLAVERKKQIAEEQKHLKELTMQKEHEAKRLQELKIKQQQLAEKHQQDVKKLADLKTKQTEEKIKDEQARLAQTEAEAKRREQAAAEQAQRDASRQAKIAGEVNKYKAMIVNAISQRWILPENVDKSLSSQFRIRLAPDGAVLEVSLIRSSGDAILDRSAQTAIYKASPLPVPVDAETFNLFRDISLTVRPENLRG